MTDDIVTRLRASYYAPRTCFELSPDEAYDLKQAADEIERLRNEVKLLQEQEKRLNLQILANFKSMDAMHKELYGDD